MDPGTPWRLSSRDMSNANTCARRAATLAGREGGKRGRGKARGGRRREKRGHVQRKDPRARRAWRAGITIYIRLPTRGRN
eukprot:2313427-Pyramimonas_sp.AAC.2